MNDGLIQQLRVNLDNRPGSLLAMVKAISAAGVDMKALQLSSRGSGEQGVAHLIVVELEQACEALKTSGHSYEVEDAVCVEMDDRVGGLAAILEVLAVEQINVAQLYAFVSRLEGKSLAVCSVDDPSRAIELLAAAGHRLLSRKRLRAATAPQPDQTTFSDHLGNFIW